MKKQFTEKIFNDFPDLFKHKDNKKISLMFYGVCCDDGWFNIVYNLTKKINEIVKRDNLKDIEIVQIKEKFGSLRYYVHGGTDEMYDFIRSTENESSRTCEICGNKGKLNKQKMWLKTVCEQHWDI